MPILSMFQGIIIRMYYKDNREHHLAHIHAEYQVQHAVYDIETGDVLAGSFPRPKERLVLAWIELHRDELAADWQLAVHGEEVFRIDPLR